MLIHLKIERFGVRWALRLAGWLRRLGFQTVVTAGDASQISRKIVTVDSETLLGR